LTQGEVIDQFMKNAAQVDTEVALVENDDDLRKVIYHYDNYYHQEDNLGVSLNVKG
jgi:hypothetical protein